ncbi:MAG: calcium/sodium antiporter [Spirochaetes bacterium]|nr:calcium/sodium antiporter [Spirochaetota bacterium]MBN2769721.1 calcium/sodium antiporter [Spirochaetota bacterium]
MLLIQQFALLAVSIVLLWFGANYLVDSAEKIANRFGVSQLVIGLTIVAFGTSAPEFAVTVNAALRGQASISVGNIVGSNIFNLGFILGLVALFHPVAASRKLVYRDGLFMTGSAVILLVFFLTGGFTLSRIEGAALFILLLVYLAFLFIKKDPIDTDEISNEKAKWYDFIIAPLSVAVIAIGGQLLVTSSVSIAKFFGISEWVIAITIVAGGTSAPELVTSLAAVLKGKHDISAGNLVGSNIFNILGVLGVAGMINPLTIDASSFESLILLVGMIVLSILFFRTGWKVSRKEGIILILCGLAMWAVDFITM